MSALRRWTYVAVLGVATVMGLPLAALIECYNIASQPQTVGDLVVAAAFHVGFVVLVALILVAWRKLLRARPS